MNRKSLIYISLTLTVLAVIGLVVALPRLTGLLAGHSAADVAGALNASPQAISATTELNITQLRQETATETSDNIGNGTSNTAPTGIAGQSWSEKIKKLLANILPSKNKNNSPQPPLNLRGGEPAPAGAVALSADLDGTSDSTAPPTAAPIEFIPFSPPPTAKKLTDEEIYNIVYPDYYRDGLSAIRQQMIYANYLNPNENYDFMVEEDIYAFLEKSADYWVKIGAFKANEKERYLTGLKIGRGLIQQEKEYYKLSALGKKIYIAFGQLANFLTVRPARAAGEICAGAYGYRMGAAASVGANVPGVSCCNCGYFCSYGCAFVADCSKSACNVSSGCLNLYCPSGAAIWDSETFICGCGGM